MLRGLSDMDLDVDENRNRGIEVKIDEEIRNLSDIEEYSLRKSTLKV